VQTIVAYLFFNNFMLFQLGVNLYTKKGG